MIGQTNEIILPIGRETIDLPDWAMSIITVSGRLEPYE